MSELTRRDFLKLGAVGTVSLASGTALTALAQEPISGGRSVSRTTGTPRQGIPSTCLMCPARCGIIGFLEDNILVKIEGNPKDPNSRGRLCAKGVAGIQLAYNPDRILYPLRRTGARGEGGWEQISWEEAYSELADRLKPLRENGQPEGLVFQAGMDDALVSRFLRAFGTPNITYVSALHRTNKEGALDLTWGARQDINDAAHTKYILNFGANPYEAHDHYVPFVQRIIDGRMSGARLITLDPRISNTAGKSDEWQPLKPGTDGLVALAMANVIMQLGLYDDDFVSNWINYPVEDLAEHLRQYTLEMAESISGAPAGHIRRIAIEFASNHPATAVSGRGVSMHANGVQNERAIALLNAITGNIDIKGGYCLPRIFDLAEPDPLPPEPAAKGNPLPQQTLPLIKEGGQKAEVFMTYMHDPVYNHPNPGLSAEVLKDEGLIPYFVAIDSYMTESAMLADLVLPAATYLESWDIHSVPAYELVPFIGLRQPVIKPQGESVPFHDMAIELAQRIGGGMEEYFAFGTMESYIAAVTEGIDDLARAGGLEFLREDGVWFDLAAHPTYLSYEENGFNTPSGKFEVYAERLEEMGFALPSYEAAPDHHNLQEDEFILITFQWNVHTYGLTANSMWLSEIIHDNPVWINTEVAEAMRIERGDLVRVSSATGSLEARAHLTEGIDPRVIAMGGSVGHRAPGRIARAEKFYSHDPNTRLIWWEEDGVGVHPHPLIPVASDPIGGGQAWQDTKVTIVKV